MLHVCLKIASHFRHELEVSYYRMTDGFRDSIALLAQLFQNAHQLAFELGVLHFKQKIIMPALAHQIADALVHGNSRRWHQARH